MRERERERDNNNQSMAEKAVAIGNDVVPEACLKKLIYVHLNNVFPLMFVRKINNNHMRWSQSIDK